MQFNRRIYSPESRLYVLRNVVLDVFMMLMRLNPAYTHALVRQTMLDTVHLYRRLRGQMGDGIAFMSKRSSVLEALGNAGLDSGGGVCVHLELDQSQACSAMTTSYHKLRLR